MTFENKNEKQKAFIATEYCICKNGKTKNYLNRRSDR